MRLKKDEMYDQKLKSPTGIEKVLGPKGENPAPRKWIKVEGLITRAKGALTLVPESDKRPEEIVKKLDGADFNDHTAPKALNPERMI
jgi:hypothetical protein